MTEKHEFDEARARTYRKRAEVLAFPSDDPMRFDITRPNLKEHVAFGKGVHHCLGAALSRREMNGGFKVIFERMENFRMAPGAAEPEFSANALLHGLTGIEIAFDKRS